MQRGKNVKWSKRPWNQSGGRGKGLWWKEFTKENPGSTAIAAQCVRCWPAVVSVSVYWRLRGNIIRTASCWVVWHSVHSQQHTHVSSSYRSSRLGLSHWDPYAMH